MKIKAAVFDIDGTLVPYGAPGPGQAAVQALRELAQSGVAVVIATGRARYTAQWVLGSGIKPDYFAAVNGADVTDAAGRPVWQSRMTPEEMYALVDFCEDHELPLEFIFSEDGQGCHAEAKRISDGKLCVSTEITMQLAKNEGWIDKSGSKWKTMPQQMMMYRAASFFAKVYCPEILFGIQTVEEVKDTKGYDETEKQTVKISLEDSYGKFQ